jgi:hypothetical protein
MQKMKFFVDVHDQKDGTFPAGISKEDFAAFFQKYEAACRDESVVLLRVHVGFQDRAYCFTMAESPDAVRRAHARVGLPFESITEVATATPGDLFFAPL